ncbi:hypothetical protein VOLCADRAFT_89159 [Volvox carteri f. nagariensis]|uniref:Uncharacterized protein n=1 Tax=Volvox carteri f. nagariensis TaxID=3068 RepID=D8TQY5_VOLCA|nr:uncharacterized protein VOLCADRAFT_89159 [Volvox carteri f. nagariensis]EFJ50108.1 hypothetical protein VOLCADRAFT_89159 [Volvox carteri f. nagariensis]|eukprot:XP_002948728.1 hypothetical protein VOLCADRAFT_89159 [Volvox carteri f. nagariensis]
MAACPRRIDPKIYLGRRVPPGIFSGCSNVRASGLCAHVVAVIVNSGIHIYPRARQQAEAAAQVHRLVLLKVASAALLLLAAGLAVTSGRNFVKRCHMIRTGVGSDNPGWDSRWLPRVLTGVMTGVMAAVLAAALCRVFGRG